MDYPFCSIIIVNFNGQRYLDACLRSFEQLDYPTEKVGILVVDNGSDDGSDLEAQVNHPRIRLLRSPKNNFAAALNFGVAHAQGRYMVFANNDVSVKPSWLTDLVQVLEATPRAGAAGGKILFEDGRINSVGHRALPDFYWEDEGYGQEDRGQYDFEREVEGLCWAAVLFRKACLDDIGPIDEDFVLYYEDVDTSLRCRRRGWKILYSPGATARHVFHGSSQGSTLTEYFCDRGRLIYVSKHHPEQLAGAVQTSRFVTRQDWESLYDVFPVVIKKLSECHPAQSVQRTLEGLGAVLIPIYGSLAVDHLLARMQVILGHRKMSIGFYDQALQVIGGGQRYGATMAAALQDRFDVTLIASKPVSLVDLENWYRLLLPRCRLKIIPLPHFEKFGDWIDSNAVTPEVPNPFNAIAAESRAYDVFVNVNMLTMVRPLAPFSVFLCHFPDTARRCYFAADEYSALVVNSHFTAHWVKALWELEADLLLYPPVDVRAPRAEEKENVILSVARFEVGGSKKQHELIRAFEQLWTGQPDLLHGWRLVLVGGSLAQNRYLEDVRRAARACPAPVEIHVNVPIAELEHHYGRAKIFWHACGLNETNPHLIEHFGMTTVEAMQNRCVPIVINGGGQREIVEHGRSGFRFDSLEELGRYTCEVISNPDLVQELAEDALRKSEEFSQERFQHFVQEFFRALEEEYRTIPTPDPRDVLRKRQRPNLFYSPVARHGRLPIPHKATLERRG